MSGSSCKVETARRSRYQGLSFALTMMTKTEGISLLQFYLKKYCPFLKLHRSVPVYSLEIFLYFQKFNAIFFSFFVYEGTSLIDKVVSLIIVFLKNEVLDFMVYGFLVVRIKLQDFFNVVTVL